jgi:hypothetical protein
VRALGNGARSASPEFQEAAGGVWESSPGWTRTTNSPVKAGPG